MDILDLYALAEEKSIYVYAYPLPDVPSLVIKDKDADCHIALSFKTLASATMEKACLAHDISHCETDAFYSTDAPESERARMEYRADKRTVGYLVPWELYSAAIMAGYFTDWEQAEYWDVPQDYVPAIHKVYERTRWNDVQRLKHDVWDRN